jgi:nucleotide-binding universal stress UspA family protein
MYKKILVAIDGSPTAARGFKAALELAADQGALLQILHVVDERMPLMDTEAGAYLDEMIAMLRDSGRKVLARAEAEARKHGVTFKAVLAETMGLPVADIIVQQAKKLRANIIVLGTHGRRGVSRLVMGSDAEGVVRESPVPVLLIRSQAKRAAAKRRK